MSELPSALFSIADGSEFRFARFYNVCEAAALAATRKFAHCLRFVGHTPGVFKRGRDTESDANIRLEEILTFFSNEFPSAFPSEIPRCGLLSDNITYQRKHDILIATVPKKQAKAPRCFCLPISTSLLYVDLRLYAEFVLILLQYRIYNICKECIHLYRCASDILGRLHGCLQLL